MASQASHLKGAVTAPTHEALPHIENPSDTLNIPSVGISDTQASPRTLPLSFSNLSVHEKDTTNGARRIPGQAILTIRKSRSSRSHSHDHSVGSHNSPAHYGSLDSHGTSSRRHRRQSSTEFTLSPTNPKFLELNKDMDTSKNDESLYSPASSFEDSVFPVDISGGGDEPCHRHHHRQSISSTVSIDCSDHGDSDHESEFSYGEIEIPMQPVAANMLIALLNRSEEMVELLAFPNNQAWVRRVQYEIGMDMYQSTCLPLWTATERSSMSDFEWLRRSKQLLTRKSCGGAVDGYLWSTFCDMVGGGHEESLDEDDYDENGSPLRSASQESIVSDYSDENFGDYHTLPSFIAEESEDEEQIEIDTTKNGSVGSRAKKTGDVKTIDNNPVKGVGGTKPRSTTTPPEVLLRAPGTTKTFLKEAS